jgi:hypothetical protein
MVWLITTGIAGAGSGSIVDSSSHAPISGAAVSLHVRPARWTCVQRTDSATTATDGHYDLPGKGTLEVHAPGYLPRRIEDLGEQNLVLTLERYAEPGELLRLLPAACNAHACAYRRAWVAESSTPAVGTAIARYIESWLTTSQCLSPEADSRLEVGCPRGASVAITDGKVTQIILDNESDLTCAQKQCYERALAAMYLPPTITGSARVVMCNNH